MAHCRGARQGEEEYADGKQMEDSQHLKRYPASEEHRVPWPDQVKIRPDPGITDDYYAVIYPPEDEFPVRTVPEPHYRPCYYDNGIGFEPPPEEPREGQRIIDILLYPCCQAHVPPLPEVIDVGREERDPEICRELYAHCPGQAARHIRITREVRVHLTGEGIGGDQKRPS